MEYWRNYRILGYLLLTLTFLTSCEKDLIDDCCIEEPISNPPPVYYNTSVQNHEWNDGWFNNNTHNVGNKLNAEFLRGFTYIDYQGDGDMDVFICRPPFLNSGMGQDGLDYGILVKEGNDYVYKKDMIEEQLPYYASLISPADLDNDGDMDIVIFIADDAGNYNGGTTPNEPSGGIFAYIWEDGKYRLTEIEPYIEGGNQFFYHGGTLGDVNGDGLVDIVAGTQGGQTLWLNKGNLIFEKYINFIELNNGFSTYVCSQFLFDINKDGYLDYIVGYPKDQLNGNLEFSNHVYIYFGTGVFPYYNENPDITLQNPYTDSNWENVNVCMIDLSIFDFDNDGDYDIFTNSYSESGGVNGHLINYYENNNNTFEFKNIFKEEQQFYNGCRSGFMKVFDIDNDGNKEILLESGLPSVSSECSQINGYKLIEGKLQKTKI